MATILVVDDSDIIRGQVKDVMISGGYKVIEAANGLDGLAKLNENIKLILSDLNMPKMDGLTMCAKIKEMENYKGIPIFMMTTESNPELKARGKEIGIMAWIVKPFNAEKILPIVKKIIGE